MVHMASLGCKGLKANNTYTQDVVVPYGGRHRGKMVSSVLLAITSHNYRLIYGLNQLGPLTDYPMVRGFALPSTGTSRRICPSLPPSPVPYQTRRVAVGSVPPSLPPSLPPSFPPSFPPSLLPSLPPSQSLPYLVQGVARGSVSCRSGEGTWRSTPGDISSPDPDESGSSRFSWSDSSPSNSSPLPHLGREGGREGGREEGGR